MADFFFNDTATTEIYTRSLHDALPICRQPRHQTPNTNRADRPLRRRPEARPFKLIDRRTSSRSLAALCALLAAAGAVRDRKSTRLNSSHANISYAVFCLKTQ